MSKRPIEAKKRRKVAKAVRRRQLPAYFDLVQWVLDHTNVRTRKQARDLILAGRVKANSHPVGFEEVELLGPNGKSEKRNILRPHVRAELKRDLLVASA